MLVSISEGDCRDELFGAILFKAADDMVVGDVGWRETRNRFLRDTSEFGVHCGRNPYTHVIWPRSAFPHKLLVLSWQDDLVWILFDLSQFTVSFFRSDVTNRESSPCRLEVSSRSMKERKGSRTTSSGIRGTEHNCIRSFFIHAWSILLWTTFSRYPLPGSIDLTVQLRSRR